jgi:hypothetical protein
LLVAKRGIPAIDERDEDDMPVFGAEVPTVPWRASEWPDRAMTAQEVRWRGLGGLTPLAQDHSSCGAEGIEHCLSIATCNSAGHGASFG